MARDKGLGSVYQVHDHPSCPSIEHTANCPPANRAGKRPRHNCDGTRPKHRCRGHWFGVMAAGYTETGNRRRITVTAKTKADAQTALKNKMRKTAEAGAPAPASARTTVKLYADDWLAQRATKVRPKSQIRDESALRRWIVPTIGARRLEALNPGDVRSVTRAITNAGRSSSSAHRVQSTLMKMLKDAKVDGHQVPSNVLLVTKPAMAVNDRRGLEVMQAVAMLTTASIGPEPSRVGAALIEGMRQGECLGLTRDLVDLKNAALDVSWQLQDLPYEHGCREGARCGYKRAGSCPERRFRVPYGHESRHLTGAWHLVRPKTAHGQRFLPLVDWMVDVLTDWLDRAPDSPYGLVWCDVDGGPILPAVDGAMWRSLQERAGVAHPAGRPYNLHEARHTTASLLAALSVPEVVRIAILGHAGIAATRHYEHSAIAQAREALNSMSERLGLTSGSRPELPA